MPTIILTMADYLLHSATLLCYQCLLPEFFNRLIKSQLGVNLILIAIRIIQFIIQVWDLRRKRINSNITRILQLITHPRPMQPSEAQPSSTATKRLCATCKTKKAFIKRPKTSLPICQECFYDVFETEIHQTIVNNNLFRPGDKIAIGTSGGKDSTVINHVLNKLNNKYKYGVDLFMLSIDEGIAGYRDDSLETVKRNQVVEGLPLQILSYKDLYGWTMDEIVKVIGRTNNCTYCGVFRRQALERGALKLGCNKIVTGHNADDIAETVLLNMLRGDFMRLSGCVNPISGDEDEAVASVPRIKPFKYSYEKEIVLYAFHKKLEYFSTECVYSPFAFRGHVRELIKKLEAVRPSAILDIIYSAENIKVDFNETTNKMPERHKCEQCGFITSHKVCKACTLLEGLNKGKPKLGIKKSKQN